MKKLVVTFVLMAMTLSVMLVPSTASANSGDCVLWGVTGVNFGNAAEYSEVFKVNTSTGAVTMVNNDISNPLYSDIAMTPKGSLYAIGRSQNDKDTWDSKTAANFDDLYRLDPTTGAVMQTWSDVFDLRVNALAAEDNTHLLAIEGGGVCTSWETGGPKLLRINLTPGGDYSSITNVGTIAAPGAESLCSDGDLDKDPVTGKWYAGFWAGAGSEMVNLDIVTPGNSALVSQSGIQWQGGFAFCSDGTAYAGSWAAKNLYTVNVAGGGNAVAHDLSGDLAGNIFGLSVVFPPPVGGGEVYYPVNKLGISTPWLALLAVIIAGAIVSIRYRRIWRVFHG